MKIAPLLTPRFSRPYFKEAAEDRGQSKSRAWCNYIPYQKNPNLGSDVLQPPVWLFSLLRHWSLDGTGWWNDSLSKPIHLLQINSHLSPAQQDGSLRFKWGAFQIRLLSARNGRSLVRKWITKHIVWFNTLPWAWIWLDVKADLIGSNEKMPSKV